ncbi:Serine/threonine-phosphatase 7 long form-like protein [Nymphaea thermarum]|nr:Serine/threonine-phosphatase 7 long form-like protein [Nymphaea thermarum]
MFPDHLEDCGLEEAVSLAIQPINGNLIHAIAERWNPRTNTFWFSWGEMTITLDEFSNIMGLPEPKGDPRGPIEDQFLVNQGQVKTLEVIRKLTGKQSWPFLEKDGHQYLQLQELGETYSQFVNPASLSRSVADKYKNSMVTCIVGLIFFNNEEHIIDFRTARLFRKWGHVKVCHISITMAALAFLYRGLTKFSIGDADSIEGCVFTLQAWFYKHVGPQSCHFQNTDGQLSNMEHYRRRMEEVDDFTIIWDFFDREVIKSRYTYNPVRGSLLLGPFFIVEYHPERCLRKLSLRQRKAYPIESEGAIVERELDTEEWSGIYTYAQQRCESFAHLYLVLGPGMGLEYVNIRFMVETRSQSRRRSEMELDQPFIGDRGEESSSETPPKLEINDPEFEEYKRFRKYMIMFNEEQAQAEKAKKKGALFRCFPRSLEGIAAQWYREHINPMELKIFDKLINIFIERFIQNVETAPTITTLCYLKQRPGEKVRDFIQRWRSSCNKMRDPISQSHALGLIVNNLTQPLRSFISNAPIKSFIDLTERVECIEAGIENGAFDVVIPVKVREDTKKNSRSQNAPANIVANAAAFKKEKSEYPKNKGVMDRASGSSSGTKNKHPGWGYDRKFTPLQQSYEEIMHMLIERVKQDSLIEIDQKLQVWDLEPLGSIFTEVDPLPEVKKGGFSPNRENEWALELCENSLIIFSDKDLPTRGASHNDALHIVVETRGTRVSHILIDGGASLNICPQQTARELGIRQADYTPSTIFIHGYDGT